MGDVWQFMSKIYIWLTAIDSRNLPIDNKLICLTKRSLRYWQNGNACCRSVL